MTAKHHAYLPPSLLTLGNLMCGFTAVVLLTGADAETELPAAALILLAMLLDGFDGLAARALGVASAFGARLDSLADVVSFGVAPALLVTRLSEPSGRLAWAAAAWLLCAAVLRLARWDADAEQADQRHSFQGLPCPAAACLLAGVAAALATARHDLPPESYAWLRSTTERILPAAAVGLGLLMVSGVAYPHPLKWLAGRPHGFGVLAAALLSAVAVAVAVAVASLGGYAPLAISGLFVVSPLGLAIAMRPAGLATRRREG